MWEFLSEVLRQGGTVAVLFAAVIGGALLTIKQLWSQHLRMVQELQQQHAVYAARLDAMQTALMHLQERRVQEAQAVTEKVIAHVSRVDRSMDKIATSLEVLIELSGRRGAR